MKISKVDFKRLFEPKSESSGSLTLLPTTYRAATVDPQDHWLRRVATNPRKDLTPARHFDDDGAPIGSGVWIVAIVCHRVVIH